MDAAASSRGCEFLGFRMDPRQHTLIGPDGRAVTLASRSFQTLLYMVEHAGDLLSKEALLRAVWPDTVVEENNLNQCITALRRALGDTRGEHRFIVTIPGRGYRFVAPVRWDAPASLPPASTASGSTGSVVPSAQVVTVAVLPFENLSPLPDDAYFAVGLHQELIDQLSKVRAIGVLSRAAVMKYARTDRTVFDIAQELNVSSILVGSVRFGAKRIRVSTELVDAQTQRILWSETYERGVGDVFRIEADIATNVATALQVQLLPEEQARVARELTRSPEAHALYMQARAAADGSDTQSAISLVERATLVDPEFAHAHAYASFLCAGRLINTPRADAVSPARRAEFQALSEKFAKQALTLDPDVPWVRTALAVPAIAQWRWREAESILAPASQAPSDDPDAPILHGFLLTWMGRQEDAIALIRRSRRPNPADSYSVPYAALLAYASQFSAAAEVLDSTIRAQPTHLVARDWMAMMEIRRGNLVAAGRQLELAEHMAGDSPAFAFLPEWVYLHGRMQHQKEAERLFHRLESAVLKGAQPGAGDWAMAFLGIGDTERALGWLEEAGRKAKAHEAEESNLALMNLKMNITDDPVLNDPTFARVLRHISGD